MHMAQLMPLPLIVSCFSEIQIGFTFLVPADRGSPGQRAVKRACVCGGGAHVGCVFTSRWLCCAGARVRCGDAPSGGATVTPQRPSPLVTRPVRSRRHPRPHPVLGRARTGAAAHPPGARSTARRRQRRRPRSPRVELADCDSVVVVVARFCRRRRRRFPVFRFLIVGCVR